MRRRAFIGSVFSGLGIMGLYAKPPKPQVGGIPKRKFGRTGEELTVIGQGGARLALIRSEADARKHVRYAFDLGINYFDCAFSYWGGLSEEAYGDALKEVRQEVFITTKTTKRTASEVNEQLEASLKRLKTDYVDLWQLHGIKTKDEVQEVLSPGGAI
jgi:aryl-alcohol dehydrogenase-like predicted oxidoreductase